MIGISLIIKSVRIGGYIAVVCHDRSALANQILGQKSPICDIKHLQLLQQMDYNSFASEDCAC